MPAWISLGGPKLCGYFPEGAPSVGDLRGFGGGGDHNNLLLNVKTQKVV